MTKSPSKTIQISTNLIKKGLLSFFLIFTLILIAFVFFELLFLDKIFPAIYVANTNLTGLTRDQANTKISSIVTKRSQNNLELIYYHSTPSSQIQKFLITPENIQINPTPSIDKAFTYGRSTLYFKPTHINLSITFTPEFDDKLSEIAKTINQPAINAQLKIDDNIQQQINVTPSQDGLEIDIPKLKENIKQYLITGTLPDKQIPTKIISPKISYQTALVIKQGLDKLKISPLKLTFKDQSWIIDLNQALEFIDLENSQNSIASGKLLDHRFNIASFEIGNTQLTESNFSLNKDKIATFLETISPDIDQPVKEPLFSVDPSSSPDKPKVTEFQPPQLGQKLNIKKTASLISQNLLTPNIRTLELEVEMIEPKNKLVNDLGIKELIGRGISHFAGSIENRIYNVKHAASKLNGLLISPGETFSFVNTVGDISAATGFKPAYVIKSGRTVLDDGGGVCQVSTTVFRAALNAGLPIPKRTAHAYRVAYYEQGYPPGLDATIFHPTVDLQFKNDTQSHILIQSYVIGTTMYIDLYGTSDGRITELSKPITSNITPAPPELRQDDPTLPKGTIKQVDWAAPGANVTFTRKVTRNQEIIINETYRSNYRPWQAVYLVGTKEN